MLRLENVLLLQKSLPSGTTPETNNEQLLRLVEELKHENEELRLRMQQLEENATTPKAKRRGRE